MSHARHLNGSNVLPVRPRAGVCLHFTSLPGPHGIGDIGDASLAMVDRLADMGLHVWQFLPIGPTAYGDSPYQPLSAFAGNENLVGLDELVRLGLLRIDELQPLEALPRHTVDYGAVIPAKGALLRQAAERFLGGAAPALRGEYEAFLDRHQSSWLRDYSLFRILKTLHGERPWPEWSADLVHREPQALERARRDHRQAIDHTKVLQFLFDRQWRTLKQQAGARGVRLFGDIPIYIALDSSDAWARPDLLLIDKEGRPAQVSGVPPDYFSEDGQLWGNPLYDWERQARHGFDWWVQRMQDADERFDMLRIDHFRGFEAYWSIPVEDDTARNGQWLPGPGDALFEAMEAALGSLPIVAEDLGVITPEVDALRLRHGIPGMKVLQFEVEDPEFTPNDVVEECVCYTGTHDNDTTLGWFRGGRDDVRTPEQIETTQRQALHWTGGQPETIAEDMIRFCFDTRARVALAPMQDFLGLGSEARINIPGTTLNNWRWRLRSADLAPEFVAHVRSLVDASSRT